MYIGIIHSMQYGEIYRLSNVTQPSKCLSMVIAKTARSQKQYEKRIFSSTSFCIRNYYWRKPTIRLGFTVQQLQIYYYHHNIISIITGEFCDWSATIFSTICMPGCGKTNSLNSEIYIHIILFPFVQYLSCQC